MKKLHLIGLVLVCGLAVATVAYAAGSITLSPTAKTVTAGQTFTVSVTAAPSGTAYTAKAVVRYPANLLEVKSFSFGSGWLPLTQAGYDTVDNTNGVLVKTAGYPGGFAVGKTLGTITFKAKAAGAATVGVGGDSMLLDAENANLFSAGGQTVVTIKPYVPPPSATPDATISASVSPTSQPEGSPEQETQAQASGTGGTLLRIGGIAALALIIFGIARWLSKRRKKEPTPPQMPQI